MKKYEWKLRNTCVLRITFQVLILSSLSDLNMKIDFLLYKIENICRKQSTRIQRVIWLEKYILRIKGFAVPVKQTCPSLLNPSNCEANKSVLRTAKFSNQRRRKIPTRCTVSLEYGIWYETASLWYAYSIGWYGTEA